MGTPTPTITGAHPVVVGAVLEQKIAALEADVQDLRDQNSRQSTFQRWLIGILVGVGITIGGAAYSAHRMLADRLIEVQTLTNESLVRIEERLVALRDRFDREEYREKQGQQQGARYGSAGSP